MEHVPPLDGVVCLVLTTMGKVLVRWEVDSTVPFRFQQLGLLLASLFQFSRQQDYAHVEMKNGYSVVFSADAAAQIATAVVLRSPRHDKTRRSVVRTGLSTACTDDLPVHVARLKSLIILREFLRSYADDIDALVASGKADAQAMADNYTLSSALQGVGGPLDEDVSCDVFLPFQANFIASIMERPLLEGLSEPAQNLSSKTIGGGSQREAQVLTRGFFMNAASGDVLSSFVPADMVVSATAAPVLAAIEGSNKVGTLLARVALAMHEAFPVLYQTSLMKRARINSHIGFSNSKVNSTTVVVRLKSQILSRLNTSQFFIALRMMPVGVFAGGVYFHGVNSFFQGHQNELMRAEDLQRVLVADSRGGKLYRLIQEASDMANADFELHMGSDGLPPWIVDALDSFFMPWAQPYRSTASLVRIARILPPTAAENFAHEEDERNDDESPMDEHKVMSLRDADSAS